jgi:hypothetical protein
MMKVYTTMVLNFLDKYSLVETFTTLEVAMARALALGKEYDASNMDDNPSISSYNEAVQYFVLSTPDHMVVVLETELLSSLPHFRGDHQHSAAPVAEVPACTPKYDPYDDELPGGWNYDGQPITMKQVREAPDNVKFSYQLTEAQRWALVKARIIKSPNYHVVMNSDTLDQKRALAILGKSWREVLSWGLNLVEYECEFIDNFITDKILDPEIY